MEIVLKRSQTSLREIQSAMSKYFDISRITPGRHEWIDGELKTGEGLGKQDPGEDARISVTVPYDEKSRRTLMTRILSPFSGTLYYIRLQNLDLPTTLAVVKGLQDLGDVGFASTGPAGYSGGRSGGSSGIERVYIWPEGREAQLSKAAEIQQLSTELHESYLAHKKPEPETPPHKICGGMPSGELCPRCKYNILRSGAQYCDKHHKGIDIWN